MPVTSGTEIWEALRQHLPRGQWIPLQKVYEIVKANLILDDEDLARPRSGSAHPRWKTTVRSLLRAKKDAGIIRGRPAEGHDHLPP